MSDHLIAIVGSLFPGRQYDPPAPDVPGGRAAARAIGKELARRGCRLAVYDHTSIEGDVVAGFLSATPPPKEQSIEIHYSVDTPQRADFPERKTGQENFFVEKPDTSKEWEVSYYRTLGKVDGLVLVGGGPSTLVTGLIGLTFRLPMIALGKYGGAARVIWQKLEHDALPARDEHEAMGATVADANVGKCVDSLEKQAERRRDELRAKHGATGAGIALLLLLGWLACLFIGLRLAEDAAKGNGEARLWFTALLFFAPALAGASGATIRGLRGTERPTLKTSVLGVTAAVITALLYTLGQFTGNDNPYRFLLLAITIMVGWAAGFTFDTVLKKLETEGVEEIKAKLTTKTRTG